MVSSSLFSVNEMHVFICERGKPQLRASLFLAPYLLLALPRPCLTEGAVSLWL